MKYKMIKMMMIMLTMTLMMIMVKNMTTKKMIMVKWKMTKMLCLNMEFTLMMDEKSTIFSYTVMLITIMVMMYSTEYFKTTSINNIFMKVTVSFVSSMMLLIFSNNMMSLIMSWEMLGVTSFILIMIYKNKKSLKSAFFTIMMNRMGDVMLIMSMAMMMSTNSWNYEYFSNMSSVKETLMMMMAMFSKSAQIPFSSWLTEAMAAPTPISALVHSSTLVTAGVYVMLRSETIMLNTTFKAMTLTISVLTLFMAAINSLMETDLKKIIALSTMMQMSMMFLMISMKMTETAFMHLIIHATFKAMIFMTASSMIKTFETQDIRKMSQTNFVLPSTTLSFNLSNMSMSGMMFMSGFYSKDMMMEESFNQKMSMILMTIEMMSMMCSVVYSMKMIMMMNKMTSSKMKMMKKDTESMKNKTINVIMTMNSVIMGNKLFWMSDLMNSINTNSMTQKLMPMMLIIMAVTITKTSKSKKNSFKIMMMSYMIFSKTYTIKLKNTYMFMLSKTVKMTEKGMQEMMVSKTKVELIKMNKKEMNTKLETTIIIAMPILIIMIEEFY